MTLIATTTIIAVTVVQALIHALLTSDSLFECWQSTLVMGISGQSKLGQLTTLDIIVCYLTFIYRHIRFAFKCHCMHISFLLSLQLDTATSLDKTYRYDLIFFLIFFSR